MRTPLAGIFTAIIVLLALYALTAVFFYIPSAGLSALIIHAVGDLISPPREVYKYWKTSPVEFVIFFAGVFVSVFTNIENGIYVTMAASGAVLLFRIAKSPGRFLGRVTVQSVPRDNLRGGSGGTASLDDKSHAVFLPLGRPDLYNPDVTIASPYPGVFIYRFAEGLNYLNSARHLDKLTIHIFQHTRRTQLDRYDKVGDRPWNDPGPLPWKAKKGSAEQEAMAARPTLRAVILDFGAVSALDMTAAQALVDLRNQFDRYADPDRVEWHFAGVQSRWTKRALVASGFGHGPESRRGAAPKPGSATNSEQDNKLAGLEPLVSVAEVVSSSAGASDADDSKAAVDARSKAREVDIEAAAAAATDVTPVVSSSGNKRLVPLFGANRPYFHVDVETAVNAVIRNLEARASSEWSG